MKDFKDGRQTVGCCRAGEMLAPSNLNHEHILGCCVLKEKSCWGTGRMSQQSRLESASKKADPTRIPRLEEIGGRLEPGRNNKEPPLECGQKT